MRMSHRRHGQALWLVFLVNALFWPSFAAPASDTAIAHPREFSGTLIKQVNGKKYEAQVFAKGDRLRLEYKYAIRTDYGYAAIEIIRLDLVEAWYLLAQQKELLVTTLDADDVLPIEPTLPGEHSRTLAGDATAVGRTAQLYEVQTDRHGRTERCTNGWMRKHTWCSSSSVAIATGRSPMNESDGLHNLLTISTNRWVIKGDPSRRFEAKGDNAMSLI